LQYLFTTAIQLKKFCYRQSAVSYTQIGEKSKNTEGIIPRVNSIQVWKSPFGSWFHCKTLYLIYFEASAFMAVVCGSEKKIGSTVSGLTARSKKGCAAPSLFIVLVSDFHLCSDTAHQ